MKPIAHTRFPGGNEANFFGGSQLVGEHAATQRSQNTIEEPREKKFHSLGPSPRNPSRTLRARHLIVSIKHSISWSEGWKRTFSTILLGKKIVSQLGDY